MDPAALPPSANFHEQLLDAVGQAVMATDLDGRITYWNRAAEELYGWRAEEVLGRSVLEVTPAENTAVNAAELMENLASGHKWSGEFLVRRRDGTTFPALVTDSPIFDNDGTIIGIVGVSSDVSSQKRAARELEHERMRLDGIFEHAPAASAIIKGPDHVFERVNAAFLETVGRQDILGRTVAETIPEIAEVAVPLLNEVYRLGQPFVGSEMMFQLLDPASGSYATRYFNFVYQPLTDADGTVSSIFFHGVDVTEQVVAREQVREAAASNERVLATGNAAVKKSELRLRSLVEAISQVVWIADEHGNVLEVSDRWSEMAGVPPDESEGWGWVNLVHPDDRAYLLDTWHKLLARKVSGEVEYRMKGEDGAYRWFMTRGVPIFDESGAFVEWVGTYTDIDARKSAEAAVRKSEALYRTMFDTAHEGVWLLDSEARTTFANPSMTNMLGYTAEEMAGRTFIEFVAAEDRAAAVQRFALRKKGVSETYDLRFQRRDGSVRWMLISGSPFVDEDGKFAGSLGMLTDITERKEYEQGLIAAKEKAEELARLKSTLLTNLSHEIRTPLTGILGFADVISSLTNEFDEVREYAEFIANSGERLMSTLNSVLELAQLESGSVRISPEPFDVARQVRQLLPAFEPRRSGAASICGSITSRPTSSPSATGLRSRA